MSPAGYWPQLRAATDPRAINGDFFGPDGLMGMRGPAIKVEAGKHAYDPKVAKKLWDLSTARTGDATNDAMNDATNDGTYDEANDAVPSQPEGGAATGANLVLERNLPCVLEPAR